MNTTENFITELIKLGFEKFDNYNLDKSVIKQCCKITEKGKIFFTLQHCNFDGSIGHFSTNGNNALLRSIESSLPEGYVYKSGTSSILCPLKIFLQ